MLSGLIVFSFYKKGGVNGSCISWETKVWTETKLMFYQKPEQLHFRQFLSDKSISLHHLLFLVPKTEEIGQLLQKQKNIMKMEILEAFEHLLWSKKHNLDIAELKEQIAGEGKNYWNVCYKAGQTW